MNRTGGGMAGRSGVRRVGKQVIGMSGVEKNSPGRKIFFDKRKDALFLRLENEHIYAHTSPSSYLPPQVGRWCFVQCHIIFKGLTAGKPFLFVYPITKIIFKRQCSE
jgi:hypothetical protein